MDCSVPGGEGAGFDSPHRALIVSAVLPGERPFTSEKYPVHAVTCDDRFGYWQGLAEVWESDATLINVEHDMEFSDDLAADLADCPHPLCAHAYQVYRVDQREWVYAPGTIMKGDEWSDTVSLGFTKIAASARVRPLERMTWQYLEHHVMQATEGRWHIHWPEVLHFHQYDAAALERCTDFERLCISLGEPGPFDLPSVQYANGGR